MSTTVLFGAGGHASVIVDSLDFKLRKSLVILDPNSSMWNTKVCGVPVIGGDDLLIELIANGAENFVVAVGSVNRTFLRREIFDNAVRQGLNPFSVVHSQAILSRYASCDLGVQIMAGAIVNAAARLRENVIVNSGAIVEHDCTIEAHSHIAPGARLSGSVQVGEGAHIGVGAIVKQGVTIGAHAVVGAGAVVLKDVPPNSTVVGVPARILTKRAA